MKIRHALELLVVGVLVVTGLLVIAVPQMRAAAGTSAHELQQLREANAILLNDYRTATDDKAELYLECDRLRQLLQKAGVDYTTGKTE